jgi:hypothetical protein
MTYVDWIGSIGVFQVLLAYFLNSIGEISTKTLPFIGLNLIGASMACFASFLLDYWPFIILEGVWALISWYSLISMYKKRST